MDDSCVLRGGGCRTHSIAVATFGFGQGSVAFAMRVRIASLNALRSADRSVADRNRD